MSSTSAIQPPVSAPEKSDKKSGKHLQMFMNLVVLILSVMLIVWISCDTFKNTVHAEHLLHDIPVLGVCILHA